MNARGRSRGKPKSTGDRRRSSNRRSRSPPVLSKSGNGRTTKNTDTVFPSLYSTTVRSGRVSSPPQTFQSQAKLRCLPQTTEKTKTTRGQSYNKTHQDKDKSPKLVSFGTQAFWPPSERRCICEKDCPEDSPSLPPFSSKDPAKFLLNKQTLFSPIDVCCKNKDNDRRLPGQNVNRRSRSVSCDQELESSHTPRKRKCTYKGQYNEDEEVIHDYQRQLHSNVLSRMRLNSLPSDFLLQNSDYSNHKQKRREDHYTPKLTRNELFSKGEQHTSSSVNDEHPGKVCYSNSGSHQRNFQPRTGRTYDLRDVVCSSNSACSRDNGAQVSCDRATSPISPISSVCSTSNNASLSDTGTSSHFVDSDSEFPRWEIPWRDRQLPNTQFPRSVNSLHRLPGSFISNENTTERRMFNAQINTSSDLSARTSKQSDSLGLRQNSSPVETPQMVHKSSSNIGNRFNNSFCGINDERRFFQRGHCLQNGKHSSHPVELTSAGLTSQAMSFLQGNHHSSFNPSLQETDDSSSRRQSIYISRNLKPVCGGLIKPFQTGSINPSSFQHTEGRMSIADNGTYPREIRKSSEETRWQQQYMHHLEKQQQQQKQQQQRQQFSTPPEERFQDLQDQNWNFTQLYRDNFESQLLQQRAHHQTGYTRQENDEAGQSEEHEMWRPDRMHRHYLDLEEESMRNQGKQGQHEECPDELLQFLQEHEHLSLQRRQADELQRKKLYCPDPLQQQEIGKLKHTTNSDKPQDLRSHYKTTECERTGVHDKYHNDKFQNDKRIQNKQRNGLEKRKETYVEKSDPQQQNEKHAAVSSKQKGAVHSRQNQDFWHQNQQLQYSNSLRQPSMFCQGEVVQNNGHLIQRHACLPQQTQQSSQHLPLFCNEQERNMPFTPWRHTASGQDYPVQTSMWMNSSQDSEQLMLKSSIQTGPIMSSSMTPPHSKNSFSDVRTTKTNMQKTSGRQTQEITENGEKVNRKTSKYQQLGKDTSKGTTSNKVSDVNEEHPLFPVYPQSRFENQYPRCGVSQTTAIPAAPVVSKTGNQSANPKTPPWIVNYNTEILRTWERLSRQSRPGLLPHTAAQSCVTSTVQFPCTVQSSMVPVHGIQETPGVMYASQEQRQSEHQRKTQTVSRKSDKQINDSSQKQQISKSTNTFTNSVILQPFPNTSSMCKTTFQPGAQNGQSSKKTFPYVSESTLFPMEQCKKQVNTSFQAINSSSTFTNQTTFAGQFNTIPSMAHTDQYNKPGNYPRTSYQHASSSISDQPRQIPCHPVQDISREVSQRFSAESAEKTQNRPFENINTSHLSQNVQTIQMMTADIADIQSHPTNIPSDSSTNQGELAHSVSGKETRRKDQLLFNDWKSQHCPVMHPDLAADDSALLNGSTNDVNNLKSVVIPDNSVAEQTTARNHQIFVLERSGCADQITSDTPGSFTNESANVSRKINWHTPKQNICDIVSEHPTDVNVISSISSEHVVPSNQVSLPQNPKTTTQTAANGCMFENADSELRISGVFSLAVTKRKSRSSESENVPREAGGTDHSQSLATDMSKVSSVVRTDNQKHLHQKVLDEENNTENISLESCFKMQVEEREANEPESKPLVLDSFYDDTKPRNMSESVKNISRKTRTQEESPSDSTSSCDQQSILGGMHNTDHLSFDHPVKSEHSFAGNVDTLVELCDHRLQCVELEGQHYVVLKEFLANCFPGLSQSDVAHVCVHQLKLLSRTVNLMGSDSSDLGGKSTHVLALNDAVQLLQHFQGMIQSQDIDRKPSAFLKLNESDTSVLAQQCVQRETVVCNDPTQESNKLHLSESMMLEDIFGKNVPKTSSYMQLPASEEAVLHSHDQLLDMVAKKEEEETDISSNVNIFLDCLAHPECDSSQVRLGVKEVSEKSENVDCSKTVSQEICESLVPTQSAPITPQVSSQTSVPSTTEDECIVSTNEESVFLNKSRNTGFEASVSAECLPAADFDGNHFEVEDTCIMTINTASVALYETRNTSDQQQKIHGSRCSSTAGLLSSSGSSVTEPKTSDADDYRCEYLTFDLDLEGPDDVFMEDSPYCKFSFIDNCTEEIKKETQSVMQVSSPRCSSTLSDELPDEAQEPHCTEDGDTSVARKKLKIPSSVAERQRLQRKQISSITADQVLDIADTGTELFPQFEKSIQTINVNPGETDKLREQISVCGEKGDEEKNSLGSSDYFPNDHTSSNAVDKLTDISKKPSRAVDIFTDNCAVSVKRENSEEIQSFCHEDTTAISTAYIFYENVDDVLQDAVRPSETDQTKTQEHDTVHAISLLPQPCSIAQNHGNVDTGDADNVPDILTVCKVETCSFDDSEMSSKDSVTPGDHSTVQETVLVTPEMLEIKKSPPFQMCSEADDNTSTPMNTDQSTILADMVHGSADRNEPDASVHREALCTGSLKEATAVEFDTLNDTNADVSSAKGLNDLDKHYFPESSESIMEKDATDTNVGLCLPGTDSTPDETPPVPVLDLKETCGTSDEKQIPDYRIITLENVELILEESEDSAMDNVEDNVKTTLI